MLDARMLRTVAIVGAALVLTAGVASTLAVDDSAFAHAAFVRTWERTDKPVEDGRVSRSWMWGTVLTGGIEEPYSDSPGGQRLVQYFDKARMEITHPDAVDDGLWYVSTGLLVNELISGQMQIGDTMFLSREPAEIPIAGDPDSPDAPTYADLAPFLDAPARVDGALITQRMDGEGRLSNDPSLAVHGVVAAEHVQAGEIDHRVASVFWDFMNATDTVWVDGAYVEAPLFPNPFYMTGYPVTEAYWSTVLVAGVPRDVLWQCFQRRCLTFTPGNPPGWEVEAGNVGRHYRTWRHGDQPETPTATAVGPTPTTAPTPTATTVPTTDQLYAAFLSADQEVDNVDAEGSAVAWFHADAGGARVRFQITIDGVENITSAQIHLGEPGEDGPVVVTLFDGRGAAFTPPRLLAEDTFDADDLEGPLEGQPLATLLNALAAGDAYVNIHTSRRPNGEVRGQIAVGDEILLRADLSGENQPKPVDTDASGVALLYYDAEAGRLDYQLRVRDLQGATAAHIHLGEPGENGPVVATLFAAGSGAVDDDGVLAEGVVRANDMQGDLAGASLARLVYELVTGNAYVNVHTDEHPGGELRAQALRWSAGDGTIAFAADLSGANETEPVLTDAGGAALFRWEDDGDLTYELIVSEINDPTAAHIHLAPAGDDGDVVVTLYLGSEGQGERNGEIADGGIDAASLTGPLSGRPLQRLVYALATGAAYVNVHTAQHPAGEVRGQVELVDGAIWVAHMSGIQHDPPVPTDATGVGIFALRPSGASIHYRLIVSDLAGATAATLHIVTNNSTGPIVARLWDDSAADPAVTDGLLVEGTLDETDLVGPLTGSDLAMLVDQIPEGEVYVNIPTAEYPLGEIRGTLE